MSEKTGCSCANPGFCERHNMNKNPHFFHLCQTNERYFKLWDQCRGPGQEFTNCAKTSEERVEVELPVSKPPCQACQKQAQQTQEELKENLPSITQQGVSVLKEGFKHLITGAKKTQEELFNERMEICRACPFFIQDQERCGKCGCFLKVKAKWESSHCPIGNW